MTRLAADRTLVLCDVGFDARGPYLTVNDVHAKSQMRIPVMGRTFSLQKMPTRYCVGAFDLATGQSSACDLEVDLPDDYKDTMCPHCREVTGFNPAFYNADSISPQQRAYNMTPHFVYMAYFSPQHFKVGISSETRGIARLLEQGARACAILKRYPNADEARNLEAELCSREGILETMRVSTKLSLLSERFDAREAIELLRAKTAEHGIDPEGGFLDLTPYYFGKDVKAPDLLQLPTEASRDIMGGHCVGMVGTTLCLEQNGNVFVAPIKDWESYEIQITVGEVLEQYAYEPQQISLW